MSQLLPNRVVAYINGVRFWPRSVSYSAVAGGHASFSLDVPAVPEWDLLPARSHCAVFFFDVVLNGWRLLCEGEYSGPAWSKSASGVRAKTLQFRDMHGMWEKLTITSICSMVGNAAAETVVLAASEGKEIVGRNAGSGETMQTVMSLNALIDTATQQNTRMSMFFQALLELLVRQSPVESFFANARKIGSKAFAAEDKEIGSIVDFLRARDLILNGVNTNRLESNTTLENVILAYEDLAMYQHVPIPAPPIYPEGDATILEMLFMPHVYTVIPPACNVIFEAQITGEQGSRNLLAEPTRAVVQLTGSFDVAPRFIYFMAQSTQDAVNVVADQAEAVNNPILALTHSKFTEDELRSGVVSRHVPLGLEKVSAVANPTNAQSTASMEDYLAQSARHYYEQARGLMRRTSVQCSFLPYLVPGFPTLIEDASGPKYGIIDSVTHTLHCSGSAATSIDVGFVRDLYVLEGVNRSSPVPRWLNSKFWPANIAEFYKQLFGTNSYAFESGGFFSAMVDEQDIVDSVAGQMSEMDATSQCNMDELASKVVPTPKYAQNYARLDTEEEFNATVSRKLASSPDPVGARLLYQFRPGVSLEQYAKFHNLEYAPDADSLQSGEAPPADLCPSTTPESNGHELFGYAFGLAFVGPRDNAPYGYYDLRETTMGLTISPLPQCAARVIQAAIDRGITRV